MLLKQDKCKDVIVESMRLIVVSFVKCIQMYDVGMQSGRL